MHVPLQFWILFNLFVLLMLVLDLGVFHRRQREISFSEALGWSSFWISLAAAFAFLVFFWLGRQKALEFATGYLVEESLSVDNLFVFLVLFRYFRVQGAHQHKVLFWGILGALVMRGLFIAGGVSLINRFHWMIYAFGAFLVFIGVRMLFSREEEVDPENKAFVRFLRRVVPLAPHFHGNRFFVKQDGRWLATPLFLVLLVVEATDIVFAVDSIPAILSLTRDSFIVYTSNVFAVLGLRAIYFALAGLLDLFRFLPYGLAIVLVFIGAKMLLSDRLQIPIGAALAVVVGVLAISITASLLAPKKNF